MTRPVYPPGVFLRFDFAGAGGWLCPVGAPMAKQCPPGGEGLSHTPADGGYLPFGSSVVAGGRQQLAGGARPVPRVTSGSQNTGFPNRGVHVWTTGEAGGPVPRKAVRSRGPQVWSESGVFRLVRDLVGGALPAVAEAVAVAEHGPGAITDLYGRSCHRIRQEGSPLTIIATASRTGAFDYGHAPRIR